MGCTPLEERIDLAYGTWCAQSRQEEVACIYDGDTFYTGSCGEGLAESIRMLGVAAPEGLGHQPDVL